MHTICMCVISLMLFVSRPWVSFFFFKDVIILFCVFAMIPFFFNWEILVTFPPQSSPSYLSSSLRREKLLHIILSNIWMSYPSSTEINLNMSPVRWRTFRHASWKAFTVSFFQLPQKIFPVHICEGFVMIRVMWALCGIRALRDI